MQSFLMATLPVKRMLDFPNSLLIRSNGYQILFNGYANRSNGLMLTFKGYANASNVFDTVF